MRNKRAEFSREVDGYYDINPIFLTDEEFLAGLTQAKNMICDELRI
jgi:hypothetical protein